MKTFKPPKKPSNLPPNASKVFDEALDEVKALRYEDVKGRAVKQLIKAMDFEAKGRIDLAEKARQKLIDALATIPEEEEEEEDPKARKGGPSS